MKQKITGKVGKMPNFVYRLPTPTISKQEGLLGPGASRTTVMKYGTSNVATTPAFWYTPELTPESWLLPKSRQETIKWIRIFFNLEPYINSIITMHSRFPFSKFKFVHEDEGAAQFCYDALFNEDFDMYEFILQASLSFQKFGEFLPFGNWDAENKRWKNFVLLDPDLVEITQDMFSTKIKFDLVKTSEIKKAVAEKEKAGEIEQVPEIVLEALRQNKNIPLDSEGVALNNSEGKPYSPGKVSIVARRQDPGAVRGTSSIQSLFKCLTGDTKIALADGRNATLKELHDSEENPIYVYSISEKGQIEIKPALGVAKIGREQVIKITLDDGTFVKGTVDHPWMMRDGTYKQTKDLVVDDSFMPLYRKAGYYGDNKTTNYERVYIPRTNRWQFTHLVSCPKITLPDLHEVYGKELNKFGRLYWDSYLEEEKEKLDKIHKYMKDINYVKSKLEGLVRVGKNIKKETFERYGLQHSVLNHKVVKKELCGVEDVYCVNFVEGNHNFAVVTGEGRFGGGIFCHNTLIYQDKIRLAQIAIADRHHMPIELWTVGHLTGDPTTSILPDEVTLNDIRSMISQAVQTPPFSIVYTPLLKYEALGVSGKLLSIYEDLGFVENQILVGLGVNKNLILGEGPSFSNLKAVSLHRLIMEYQAIRDQFTNWIKMKVLLPMCIANDFKDARTGKWKIPEVQWEKSLNYEQETEERKMYVDLWKSGLISTKTLFSKMPSGVDYENELRTLEKEVGTIFDKGDKRLPKKFKSAVEALPAEDAMIAPTPAEVSEEAPTEEKAPEEEAVAPPSGVPEEVMK